MPKSIIRPFEVLVTETKTNFIKKYLVIATSTAHAQSEIKELCRSEIVGSAKELVDYELVIAK